MDYLEIKETEDAYTITITKHPRPVPPKPGRKLTMYASTPGYVPVSIGGKDFKASISIGRRED